MPSAMMSLVGLTKKDGEQRQKPGKILRWRGHSAQEATDGSVANRSADITHTVVPQTSSCLHPSLIPPCGAHLQNENPKGPSTTNAPTTQKKSSYWEQAAERLYYDDLDAYEALIQLMETSTPSTEPLPYALSKIILGHRKRMEDRQWSLPFKVRGREIKIRTQLDSIWKVLQIFIKAGSSVAASDPIHVGIPWAGTTVILRGALNDSAQNAAALEGLALIAPVIARYSEVEMIYLRESDVTLKNDFEKCLIELYTSILIYQISTACHCKRSTFTRFLRALPQMDNWDAMLRNVQVKDAACKAFTQIFDSRERRLIDTKLQNILSKQDEKMETALKMLRTGAKDREREENLKILRWISEYIPGRDHQSILVEGKLGTDYAGSGQWLFDHPKYVAWAAPEDTKSSSFWLCGSVGTGKTSIVSRVIESHLRNLDTEKNCQVAYFYCSRGERPCLDPSTQPRIVLSSLIRQMSWPPEGPYLSGPIQHVYDKWRGDRPETADFSVDECSDLLQELIAQRLRTIIIIDAIDECAEPYTILRCLHSLIQNTTDLLKLFVSSRSCIDVSVIFSDCYRVNIEGQDTSLDMFSYISNEVKEGKRLLDGQAPELEDRLIETLINHAQGMFRWVQLQLAIFLNENPPLRLPEDVEDKIEKIKNEVGLPVLNAVYNDVYDMNTQNSRRGREYAVRAYRILLCALQPLTVQMLAEAVSLDPGGKRNPHVNEKYVMAICSTFIVADDEGIVRFAHLSVAEYLRSQAFTDLYSDANAHAQAAEACLLHIVHRLPCLHNSKALTGPELSPFSDYAILFGLMHYELTSQEIRREGHRALLLSDFFGLTAPSLGFDLWTMLLNRNHNGFLTFSPVAPQGVRQKLANAFKPQPTIISVSCAWGFAEIVETILVVKDSSPETSKESLQAGLCIASRLGHVEVAKILLEKGGADANYQEKPSDPPAIFGAVLANDLPMLDLLLKHGADIEAGGPGGLTPLQAATRGSRNEGVVQCLIKNGANAFVEDTLEWTVLHTAAYNNDVFLVRLFLDMGIDPNKVNRSGETALRGTFRPGSEDGHEEAGEIAKILLERMSAAAVVSQDCHGRSALLRAIFAGLTSIVRVFIDVIDIEALFQLGRKEAEDFTVLLQALRDVDPELLESRLSTLQNIACVDSAGLVQYLKGDGEEVIMMGAQGDVTSRFTEEF